MLMKEQRNMQIYLEMYLGTLYDFVFLNSGTSFQLRWGWGMSSHRQRVLIGPVPTGRALTNQNLSSLLFHFIIILQVCHQVFAWKESNGW